MRRQARKAVSAALDQGALAANGFILIAATAASISAEEFGRFAILQTAVITATTLYRALPGTWVFVSETLRSERLIRGSVVWAVGVGAASGLPIMGGSLLLNFGMPQAILMTVASIGICICDACRLEYYRRKAPTTAAAISLLATAAFLASSAIAYASGDPFFGLTGYGLGYAGVAAIGCLIVGGYPSIDAARDLVQDGGKRWRADLANALMAAARKASIPLVVGAAAGLVAAGVFRAAQSISGVFFQMAQAVRPMFLSAGSDATLRGREYPPRLARVWTSLQVGTTVVGVGIVVAVPNDLGAKLMGEIWTGASATAVWVLIASMFNQLTMGIEIRLRLLHRLGTLARVRAVTLGPLLVLVATGGMLGGHIGAAVALIFANAGTWVLARKL